MIARRTAAFGRFSYSTYTCVASTFLTTPNSEVASNDNIGCGKASKLTFRAAAGETYRIAVDGAGGAVIWFDVGISQGPLNDDFENAIPLRGLPVSYYGGSPSGTSEPGEPNHAGNGAGQSLWWRWKAPANVSVRVKSCVYTFGGYEPDTVIGVYTGAAVGALSLVASSDNGRVGCYGSAAAFDASAGCTYYIAVDQKAGSPQPGILSLALSRTAASGHPPLPCTAGQPPGTDADDTLRGTRGSDLICGLAGSDLISGLGGNDMLYGDACGGTARLALELAAGGEGNDSVFGGRGDDRLYGTGGKDRLSGGPGNDTLSGGGGSDLLLGNKGHDTLRGGQGNDTIHAQDGRRDTINCGPGRDRVLADGQDRLRRCELIRRQ